MEHRDLNDLAVFAAIAQAGSITGAAGKMKLPKSNVSRRLAQLENRLGVQLIERNTRSSRLTSIGVCYADYCRLMVDEANAADAVVEKSLGEPTGELRVSASVLVGQQIIAPRDCGIWSKVSQSTSYLRADKHAGKPDRGWV